MWAKLRNYLIAYTALRTTNKNISLLADFKRIAPQTDITNRKEGEEG
jgi:hypothetical protein